MTIAKRLALLLLVLAACAGVHAEIGKTPGNFSVTPTGSASYVIPIWAPVGPRGTQPRIALTYNSSSGGGLVGRGWSVSGLSSITRCRKTKAQDLNPAPVNLDASDGYCIDGSRLRLTGGTYGTGGSTYQTEVADFRLVTAVGTQGNGPASFTVKSGDGLTYEYGTSGNSQVIPSGSATASTWMLRQISDTSNNRILFTYAASTTGLSGTTNIEQIDWAATSSGGGTFLYSMVFAYTANAPETSTIGYVGGTLVQNEKLLNDISVNDNGVLVRKYFMTYSTSPTTGANRLWKVTECSDNNIAGTNCLAPTEITYQDGVSGISGTGAALAASANTEVRVGDFNADGREDVLFRSGTSLYVSFYGWTPVSIGATIASGAEFLTGDIRGIGQDDILVPVGGTWYSYYWDGAGFSSVSTGAPVGTAVKSGLLDANGDGRDDLFNVSSSNVVTVRFSSGYKYSPSFDSFSWTTFNVGAVAPYTTIMFPLSSRKRDALDFNGDGRDDLWFTTGTPTNCYDDGSGNQVCPDYYFEYVALLSNGTSTATAMVLDSGTSSVFGAPVPFLRALNVNDDACTDTLIDNAISLSACNGVSGSGIAIGGSIRGVVDWDGDGRNDVLTYISGSFLSVRLSKGAGYASAVSTTIPNGGGWLAADLDGNSLDDLLNRTPSALTYYYHNGSIVPDLATGFVDGFGVTAGVTYTSASLYAYTKQDNATAGGPNYDYIGPMQIVQSTSHSNGIGGFNYFDYWYYGGEVNREGRGFTGFASRKITDGRDYSYQLEYYSLLFPLTGRLTGRSVNDANDSGIYSEGFHSTYQTLNATVANERYFPYASTISSAQYEVSGPLYGVGTRSTNETRTYDSSGNLTSSNRTVTDLDPNSPYYNKSWTTATTTTIIPDVSGNWCLRIPSAATVTFTTTVSGEPSVTRSKSFTPDYANCRVTDEVTEPAGGNRRVDTSYGFDSYGNISSVAVTGRTSAGVAMATRTVSRTFGSANGSTGGTGQFPVSDTNALGQTTTRTFNSTFGQLSTETDANGIVVTSRSYDSFGRPTRTTRPDGTSTVWSYFPCVTYGCENGDPTSGSALDRMVVVETERDTSDVPFHFTYSHFDQMDRLIVHNEQLLLASFNRVGRQYDNRGRLYRETAPCDTFSCSVYWTTNTYDVLGRMIQQSRRQSDSVATPVSTTYSYSGRTQTATDAQSKVSQVTLDVNGRMRRVKDHANYAQNFKYDAAGSLKQITDSQSNTLFTADYSYGVAAVRDSSWDADLGAWSFEHNSLGEMTSWMDANGVTFWQTYDALSRRITRTETEGTTTWTWGTSAGSYNIGRLASVSSPGYAESYGYDGTGRIIQRNIDPGVTSSYYFSYNNQGALDELTFPASTSGGPVRLKHGYSNGILQSIRDWTSGAGTVYWTSNSQNSRGQIVQETLGNGVVTNRAHDGVTGWLSSIQSGVGGGAALQNHSYLYDLVGNVTQRQENNLGLTEDFYYDSLYRLSYSQLNGSTNMSLTYSDNGNILTKSDVNSGAGPWGYHATKKHAVVSTGAGGPTYSYDLNGNMTGRGGATITWSSYNYPVVLSSGSESTAFYYGPDRQYYRQIYNDGSTTETTDYIGTLLEKVVIGGTTDWRHYVKANGQTVAIVSRLSSGVNSVSYPLEDHQESASMFTDGSGMNTVRESFGPFGLPRNGSTWSGTVPSGDSALIGSLSRRGYTRHSMLGSMGLIHMNGRVQDSMTGRFLSPDPAIPYPQYTQSYNRYSYVRNNPLSFSDPTGFADSDYSGIDPQTGLMALHETTGTGFRIENKFECGGIVGLANVCEFSDEWLRPEMVYDYEFSNSPARGGIGESSSGSVGEDSSKKKQSKQETQTACPLPSEVNRWDTLKASAGMFVDWATGTGAADREFGGDSIQSADMAMAPGVNGARSEYYRKFLDEISESRNPDLTGLNVTNWVGKFGVKEVLNATVDLNFTEHFVGSYRVDVYGGPEGTMRFVLSNNSSFKSFAYGVAPAWERLDSVPTPAGNMRQTYTWVECVP